MSLGTGGATVGDEKQWYILRGHDLVRIAQKGNAADADLPKIYEANGCAIVSTGAFEGLPAATPGENCWLGYILHDGRVGYEPWSVFQRDFVGIQRDAAVALAQNLSIQRESWGALYRALGFMKEFARLELEIDPFVKLRALVARGEPGRVTFLEDFLPPTRIYFARARDLVRPPRPGEPNWFNQEIRGVNGERCFVSTGAIEKIVASTDDRVLLVVVSPGVQWDAISCFHASVQGPRILTQSANLVAAAPLEQLTPWQYAFACLGLASKFETRPRELSPYAFLRQLAQDGHVKLGFLEDLADNALVAES